MSDIGAIGVLYARLTNNLKDYGTTQKEISDITESVSLALRVSNATVQETNSVMLQLSQSFGSGRINGQEFLAVMEGAPILMRQLAKSIGIPFGELKKLSEQGKLTADLLKQAWTDPVFLNLLRNQVKEVGTIASAYTVLVNNIKQYIGEADKATGVSKTITQAITLLADNLNTLATVVLVALIAAFGRYVAGVYASIKASQLRQIELIKETVLLERKAAAEAAAGAAQAAAMANNARATTLWAARNSAALAENASVMATVAERTSAAAKAKNILAGALTLVGGKIGLAVIAITSIIYALTNMSSVAKKVYESSVEMGLGFNGVKESLKEMNIEGERANNWLNKLLPNYEAYRKIMDQEASGTKGPQKSKWEEENQAALTNFKDLQSKADGYRESLKLTSDRINELVEEQRQLNVTLAANKITEAEYAFEMSKRTEEIKKLTGETERLKKAEEAAKKTQEELQNYYKATNAVILERLRLEGDIERQTQEYVDFINSEYVAAEQSRLDALQDSIDSTREEIQNEGKLKSAIEATTVARLREKLASLEFLRKVEPEKIKALEKEIEMRQELVGLLLSKERLDAEKKDAEESERAWKKAEEEKRREFEKTVDNIDRIFAEGFADMLNGGKSSWKSFTKSLITTFKTTVINEIYKLLLRPFVVNIIASIAGITGAGTASAEGLIGVGGNTGTGILGTISEGIRALNSNVVGSIQNLGTFIQDIPGLRDVAGFLGENAGTIAKGFAYTGAVLSALQGDLKSAAFQAAGAFLGNLTPLGPVGGAIGSFIGGAIGGLFGGSGEKYKRVLQSNQSVFTGSQFSSRQTGSIRSSGEVSDFMAQTQEAFSRNLYLILNAFGQAADITTDIYARLRRTSGRTVGDFSYSFGGVSGSFNEQFGTNGDFAKGLELLSEKVLGQVLAEAIQKSNLPAAVKSLFEGITKAEEVNALINSIVQLSDAADGLNNRFGLTVNQAAQVAQSLGLAGAAAAEFISQFAGIASSFNGVGATILKIQQSLEGQFGGTLPSSLKEFDAALKAIDKTTQSGIDAFAQLLTLRPAFEEFTFAIDSLKTGVRASIFSMVSDQEKLLMQQEDMAKIFAEYGYEVPGSVAELVNLGKSIDFTTEAGLNLAAVFPNLVTVFMQTQETVNGLVNSLAALDSSRFKTLFEFTRANAYAAAGIPLSSLPSYASGTSFVPNDGPAMIHRGERILTAEENRRYESNDTIALEIRGLREENMNMRAELRSIAVSSRDSARTLDRLQRGGFILSDVDLNGDPQILKVEVV